MTSLDLICAIQECSTMNEEEVQLEIASQLRLQYHDAGRKKKKKKKKTLTVFRGGANPEPSEFIKLSVVTQMTTEQRPWRNSDDSKGQCTSAIDKVRGGRTVDNSRMSRKEEPDGGDAAREARLRRDEDKPCATRTGVGQWMRPKRGRAESAHRGGKPRRSYQTRLFRSGYGRTDGVMTDKPGVSRTPMKRKEGEGMEGPVERDWFFET
ncbi:hypothetical protein BKA70DRAFT_1397943 [Coprinopsis sp. MPI-PUGE-AT-0042]|nr:hypothetical protein BKA70DRAFT_1397943 [Coprinopsis sp. MPI-PUGE-AT-0042]